MEPSLSLHSIEKMKERLIGIRKKCELESIKTKNYYNTKYCIDLDRCATRLRISSTIFTQNLSQQNHEITETQKIFLLHVVQNWLKKSKSMTLTKKTAKVLITELLGDSWVWSNLHDEK